MDFKSLRKKYTRFVYNNYSYKISGKNLEIAFNFLIEPGLKFNPRLVIENINTSDLKRMGLPAGALTKAGESALKNLIFHIGLIEIPSYWKATCAPVIEIKAGFLDKDQIKWWKSLLIKGLGQFFYENKIDFRDQNLVKIISSGGLPGSVFDKKLKDRYLVPFAGGRDSIVTLESLKKLKKEISLFTVNPVPKIQQTAKVSGIKKQIIVRRVIDKKLLDLNKKGFLNGHTPFTGLLSFISILCAAVFDYKNIAFSNEKSANDGNVKYLGKLINHQWAKSSEFEKMFKVYAKKYLVRDINYFSFIRKYSELEISEMLAKYPKYFSSFSSCNAGMRMNEKGSLKAKERWCGNCPKCLFVYLSLHPYLEKSDLLKIFGKDIFENKNLLPIFRQLIGERGFKPFECVGTKKETLKALNLSLRKTRNQKLPFLLDHYNHLTNE